MTQCEAFYRGYTRTSAWTKELCRHEHPKQYRPVSSTPSESAFCTLLRDHCNVFAGYVMEYLVSPNWYPLSGERLMKHDTIGSNCGLTTDCIDYSALASQAFFDKRFNLFPVGGQDVIAKTVYGETQFCFSSLLTRTIPLSHASGFV
jgi:hypothetical protein